MALEEEVVFRARRTKSGRWTIAVDGGKTYGPARSPRAAALLAIEEAERRLRRPLVHEQARTETCSFCDGSGCIQCRWRGWMGV